MNIGVYFVALVDVKNQWLLIIYFTFYFLFDKDDKHHPINYFFQCL